VFQDVGAASRVRANGRAVARSVAARLEACAVAYKGSSCMTRSRADNALIPLEGQEEGWLGTPSLCEPIPQGPYFHQLRSVLHPGQDLPEVAVFREKWVCSRNRRECVYDCVPSKRAWSV